MNLDLNISTITTTQVEADYAVSLDLVDIENLDQIKKSDHAPEDRPYLPDHPSLEKPIENASETVWSIPENNTYNVANILDPSGENMQHLAADHVVARFKQIAAEQGFDQKTIAEMTHTLFDPTKASETQQATVAGLLSEATQDISENMGLPPDWQPSFDGDKFASTLKFAAAMTLGTEIGALLNEGKITQQEAFSLQFMYYHPEIAFEGKNNLISLLDELKEKIAGHLQTTYGTESDLKPDSDRYDAAITKLIASQLRQQTEGFSLPLSDEVATLVEHALSNPDDPTTPDLIKLIASKFASAVSKIQEDFAIPATWTPEINAINLATEHSLSQRLTENFFNHLHEKIDLTSKLATSFPKEESVSILMIAKAVSDALLQLKFEVAGQMIIDANLQGKVSKIIQEATQNLTLANTAAQEKTKNTASDISTWLDRTIGLVMGIAFCFLVPFPLCLVALAVFVVITIEKEASRGGTDAICKLCEGIVRDMGIDPRYDGGPVSLLFKTIDKAIEKAQIDMGAKEGDPGIEVAQFAAKFGILVGAYGFIGPMNTLEVAGISKMSDDVVRIFTGAIGAMFTDFKPEDSEIALAAMILEAVVAILIAIVVMCVTLNPSGVVSSSSNLLSTLMTIMDVVTLAADMAGYIATIIRIVAEMEILERETDVEVANTELEGHIKVMKEVLNKLYGAGDLATEWMQQIQEIIDKYHKKNSQILSKIAGANYA